VKEIYQKVSHCFNPEYPIFRPFFHFLTLKIPLFFQFLPIFEIIEMEKYFCRGHSSPPYVLSGAETM